VQVGLRYLLVVRHSSERTFQFLIPNAYTEGVK
jgi:hypothetical protein